MLLSAYLDGELSAAERRTVEAHLGTCDRCRALLADLRQVKKLVAELPLENPPRPVVLRRRPVGWVVELAALVAVVVGLVLVGADMLVPRPAPPATAPAAADRAATRPEPATGSGVRALTLVGVGLAVAGGLAFLTVRLGRGRMSLLVGLLGLAGGFLGGCGGLGPGRNGEPPVPPGAERIVAAVRADAARRSGQDPASVRLVSIETVEWPDTSLGCPEPGKFYAQVITPGYRIVVRAAGTDYDYHTDRAGNFVLCVRGRPSAR